MSEEIHKIIAESFNIKSRTSTKVQAEYEKLINTLGNELKILMDVELNEIEKVSGYKIREGIQRVREGRVILEGGFDGQYGKVKIFTDEEREDKPQKSLF